MARTKSSFAAGWRLAGPGESRGVMDQPAKPGLALQIGLNVVAQRADRADRGLELLVGAGELARPLAHLPLFVDVHPVTVGGAAVLEIVSHVVPPCIIYSTNSRTPRLFPCGAGPPRP